MKIDVFMAFDASFVPYASTTIFSLLVHSENRIKITCIVGDLSRTDVDSMSRLAARFGAEIEFIRVDAALFAGWKLGFHFSVYNYFRLLGPRYIASDRALFLDADLLVTCDITKLWETELRGCWFAGCIDNLGGQASRLRRAPGDPYINAGVLIYDLASLRGIDFLDRCKETYEAHSQNITFADQCIINKISEGKKVVIDERWNLQINDRGAVNLKNQIGQFDRQGIFHANGPIKPWMTWSDRWLRELWLDYARFVDIDPAARSLEPRTLQELYLKARTFDIEGDWKEASQIKEQIVKHFSTRQS